jgi:hypothetical protein
MLLSIHTLTTAQGVNIPFHIVKLPQGLGLLMTK